MATVNVERQVLLDQVIPRKTVGKVHIAEVRLGPGVKAGYHRHPCPVFGAILSGQCLFQVEGESARLLNPGEAFYEPAGTPIVSFDNASTDMPLTFMACYLIDDEKALLEAL